ncbi:MAG: hypothetical protein QY302_11360 [Anaerolineales bacterium]|nr:MAG: hypothetical protein QY302_11360 [Anaerolineales bacterium]
MMRKLFFIACLFLASCNMPGQTSTSAPQAWFDMPLPDTVLLPPSPCHMIAHGASPNGIAAFEVYINGAFAFTEPMSDSQTLAVLDIACPNLVSGKNLIEVRAQDSNGDWSEFAQTTVFLEERIPADAPPPLSTGTPAPAFTAIPTLTATLTPTATSTPQPIGGAVIERISSNLVYLGDSSCGTNEVVILARATAPNGIKVVVLFYRFATDNSSSEFQSVGMKSIGGDLFEATLNPTSLLGGSVPFEQATLQYQVVVQQNDGDTSIRTPVLADIAVQACGRVTVSCSSFTEQRACIANGCNWVEIPGVVLIYECRSP